MTFRNFATGSVLTLVAVSQVLLFQNCAPKNESNLASSATQTQSNSVTGISRSLSFNGPGGGQWVHDVRFNTDGSMLFNTTKYQPAITPAQSSYPSVTVKPNTCAIQESAHNSIADGRGIIVQSFVCNLGNGSSATFMHRVRELSGAYSAWVDHGELVP